MTNCLSMENLSKLKIISHLNHRIVDDAHKSSSCHMKWEALGAQVWILLCAGSFPVDHIQGAQLLHLSPTELLNWKCLDISFNV